MRWDKTDKRWRLCPPWPVPSNVLEEVILESRSSRLREGGLKLTDEEVRIGWEVGGFVATSSRL